MYVCLELVGGSRIVGPRTAAAGETWCPTSGLDFLEMFVDRFLNRAVMITRLLHLHEPRE